MYITRIKRNCFIDFNFCIGTFDGDIDSFAKYIDASHSSICIIITALFNHYESFIRLLHYGWQLTTLGKTILDLIYVMWFDICFIMIAIQYDRSLITDP